MEFPAPVPPTAAQDAANALSYAPGLMNMFVQLQQGVPLAANFQLPAQMTRGVWTPAEDDLLRAAVTHLGSKKWTDVARFVPTRTGKQCRERWFNWLCPEIRHEPFAPWEDEIIIAKQKEVGNRWSVIAKQLPGRSTNAIKNRWHSGLKARHGPVPQIRMGIDFRHAIEGGVGDYRDVGPHVGDY
jgi:hypothetical protein